MMAKLLPDLTLRSHSADSPAATAAASCVGPYGRRMAAFSTNPLSVDPSASAVDRAAVRAVAISIDSAEQAAGLAALSVDTWPAVLDAATATFVNLAELDSTGLAGAEGNGNKGFLPTPLETVVDTLESSKFRKTFTSDLVAPGARMAALSVDLWPAMPNDAAAAFPNPAELDSTGLAGAGGNGRNGFLPAPLATVVDTSESSRVRDTFTAELAALGAGIAALSGASRPASVIHTATDLLGPAGNGRKTLLPTAAIVASPDSAATSADWAFLPAAAIYFDPSATATCGACLAGVRRAILFEPAIAS